jgi:CRISPR-associated protein Cmr5
MAKTIQGIEQGRADFAYQCAEIGSESSKPKEYKSYIKKVPMMIKTNGLGATLAFAMSKSKDGNTWELVYSQILEWLQRPDNQYLINNQTGELSELIIKLESGQYRAVTNEVLALFNWLRRFAEGLIEGEETEA